MRDQLGKPHAFYKNIDTLIGYRSFHLENILCDDELTGSDNFFDQPKIDDPYLDDFRGCIS
jgi:hypothetical protein